MSEIHKAEILEEEESSTEARMHLSLFSKGRIKAQSSSATTSFTFKAKLVLLLTWCTMTMQIAEALEIKPELQVTLTYKKGDSIPPRNTNARASIHSAFIGLAPSQIVNSKHQNRNRNRNSKHNPKEKEKTNANLDPSRLFRKTSRLNLLVPSQAFNSKYSQQNENQCAGGNGYFNTDTSACIHRGLDLTTRRSAFCPLSASSSSSQPDIGIGIEVNNDTTRDKAKTNPRTKANPKEDVKTASSTSGIAEASNTYSNSNSESNSFHPEGASTSSLKKQQKQQKHQHHQQQQQQHQKQSKKKKHSYKYYGNLPDIHWRAIPMEHLRSHPYFIPLPHPDTIKHLSKLEDARNFRQDSWQWDELHRGRCTTSQAAPALGFLEPYAASDLNIPRSLQKGCLGAFRRLSQPSLNTLEEMNDTLCTGGNGGEHRIHQVWKLMKDTNGNRNGNRNGNGSEKRGTSASKRDRRQQQRQQRYRSKSPSSTTATDANDDSNSNDASYSNNKREYPFVARYLPFFTMGQKEERMKEAAHFMKKIASPMVVRMSWGNTQEATAILTALNCFSKTDPGMRMREVGMCGAGLDMNVTTSTSTTACSKSVSALTTILDTNTMGSTTLTSTKEDEHENEMERSAFDDHVKNAEKNITGLILGASPDAVVEYSNGTLEVLEVKNHCPFVPTEWKGGRNHNGGGSKKKKKYKNKKKYGDYRIRELPMQQSVPPVYIPQLMMEMLCVGKDCRSAVMVRQTATCGAVLLRLHRDDDWIDEMLYWLGKFMTDYVNKGQVPPPNFFYEEPKETNDDDGDDGDDDDAYSDEPSTKDVSQSQSESERYKKFVKWTKALSEQVDLVENVPHSSIQRVLADRGVGLSLFLDE